jgi:hypothetical protein
MFPRQYPLVLLVKVSWTGNKNGGDELWGKEVS